jgi:hypothetical protein
MFTKDQFASAMLHECDVCLHLYSKLGPEAYGYRPSEKQRSTEELLRYLAICGIAGATCLKEANWKRFADFAGRTKEMAPEAFPEAMARQKAELEAFFAETSEDTLRTQPAPMPGGGELPLGAALLNGPFKWLTSYKLQLFLYAKANGAEIGTANAWRGVDWKG